MTPILAISFPRSGSTLLRDILQASSGDAVRWVDAHRETPLSCHNFIKNHDFDLNVTVPPGFKVLVQVRNPLDAIPSWFDLEMREGKVEDKASAYEIFFREKMKFWHRWNVRWLRGTPDLVLDHRDLLDDPVRAASRVLKVMGVRGDIVIPYPIRRASSHRDFRYDV